MNDYIRYATESITLEQEKKEDWAGYKRHKKVVFAKLVKTGNGHETVHRKA